MVFFVMFPGEFQPLGKGAPLAPLPSCDHRSPVASGWRPCLFQLVAGGCLGCGGVYALLAGLHPDFSDTLTLVRICSSCESTTLQLKTEKECVPPAPVYILIKENLENA